MLCLPIGLCVKPAFVHLLSAPEELVLERARCCAHLSPGCWWEPHSRLLGIGAVLPDRRHASTSAAGVSLELLSPLCWWQA